MGLENGIQKDSREDIPDELSKNQGDDINDIQIRTEIDTIGRRIDKIIETIATIYPLNSQKQK